jgi:hypothetical protein
MPRLNSNSRPNFDRGVGRKHRTLQRKQVIAQILTRMSHRRQSSASLQ